MINYYRTINTTTGQIEVWKGDASKSHWLLTTSNLILPLGNKPPKNVSRETIKEF